MIRWTHGLINRLVIVCDIAMLAASGALAWLVAGHMDLPSLTLLQVVLLSTLGILIFVKMLEAGGAYRVEQYQMAGRQLRQIFIGGVPAAVAVTIAFSAFIPQPTEHMDFLAVWGVLALAAILFGRLVMVRVGMDQAIRHAVLRRNVAVVGTVAKITEILEQLDRSNDRLYDVVGIYVDDGEQDIPGEIGGVKVRGDVDTLFEAVQNERIDVIVLALPWESTARINQMIERVHRIAADVVVPLDRNSFNPRFAQFATVGGLPSLRVMYQPLKGSLGVLKLVEDYVVAALGLLVSAPVLLVAAIAIKLDSRGPVVFLQQRVGFNNKPFTIYKLRTFAFDPTDDGSLGTKKTDPRITKVGAILRRLSIDELPQLVNVLKGDMSVVGPRPHVPNMQVSGAQYYEVVREYAARYRMKPGITGWAQINGMRGGINTVEKAARGVDLDLFYIENWSLWLDIKIMLLTLTRGMVGRNVF